VDALTGTPQGGAKGQDEAPEVSEASAPDRAFLDRALVRGLIWFSTARWGGQLITWGSTIVIARILTPEDFGVVAAAMVVTGFLNLATDLGMGSAIIQAPKLEQRQVEQSMAVSVLAALLMAALLYVLAPIWANLQTDSRLVPVLRVLSIAVVLTGLHVVPNGLLSRALRFEIISVVNLVQGITTAATSLALALHWRSYWALIVGYVVGRAVFTVALLAIQFVRPRVPRWSAVGGLMKFGGILTADRFLWYLRSHFDIMMIGGLLGVRPLGLYSMAMTLARMPAEKISGVISPVLFPVFSRSQVSRTELHRQYSQTLAGLALIAFPAGMGMAAVAGELVPVVLGSQWLEIIPLVIILAIGTPFGLLSTVAPVTLNAVGRVGLSFTMSAVLTVVVPLAILIGVHWGLTGVAVASIGVSLFVAPVWFFVTARVTKYPIREYRRVLATPVLGSAVMLICLGPAHLLLEPHMPTAALLAAKVLLGVGVYLSWLYWRDPKLAGRILQRMRPARG
jgi:teichuronic acid exporter